MKPSTIESINTVLAIRWDDGHESYFDFEELRRRCPCAVCRGEKNVLVEHKPIPQQYGVTSFEMAQWEYVGGYAIQPHWKDGHASGIYSYQYLRDLCTCDECAAHKIKVSE